MIARYLEGDLWERDDLVSRCIDMWSCRYVVVVIDPYLRDTVISELLTSRIVSGEYRDTTRLRLKLSKSLQIVCLIRVVVEVIWLDIGDDGYLRMIVQKVSLMLTRFDHEVFVT